MFTYRLHPSEGDDLGEATYPDRVKVGEELFFGGGRRFRVLDVVPFDEEEESPYIGLLQVEAAWLQTHCKRTQRNRTSQSVTVAVEGEAKSLLDSTS